MMDMTQSMCDIIYDNCGYDKKIHDVSRGQEYWSEYWKPLMLMDRNTFKWESVHIYFWQFTVYWFLFYKT